MNILNIFKSQTIGDITGIRHCVSGVMFERLNLWQQMAGGHAPWNDDKVISCGIMPQLCGRLHTLVSREVALDIKDENLNTPMQHLNNHVEKIVDFMAMFGGALVRPIFANGKLQYEIVPLGDYIPVRYDFDDTLLACVILKNFSEKKDNYLLCERHDYTDGSHTVENLLYRKSGENYRRVALTASELTRGLTESYTWQCAPFPMMIEFRNNAANMIDGSQVPVALIAGAEDLIRAADLHFERMNWEQVAGEKRVFADADMFEKRVLRNGRQVEVKTTGNLNRLITKIDGDGSGEAGKIHEWSPELRTAAMNEFLQQVFRRIELTINVGKGTVSDMESQVQTATQYNGGRQELYAIIDKIENEIESKYKACAEVFAYIGNAFGLRIANSEVFIEWNDSTTRKDINQTKQLDLQEVSAGIMQKHEYRMKHYGEDEETARAAIPMVETPSFNPFME